MIDLEGLRMDAVKELRACGATMAGKHLRDMPTSSERGWVAAWHAAIQRCDEDVEYRATGGGNTRAASNALYDLRRAMFEDHEDARRQCSTR